MTRAAGRRAAGLARRPPLDLPVGAVGGQAHGCLALMGRDRRGFQWEVRGQSGG